MSAIAPDIIDADVLDRVATAPVYFGHQSIGDDILAGLRYLMGPRSLSWRDEKLGRNGDPLGKIDAFERSMLRGAGNGAQFALFKLCYADFWRDLDTTALFARYERTIGRLARSCPGTTFVHVTAPLTLRAAGPRAWVRRHLPGVASPDRGNVRSHAYSERIRSAFRGSPVFDLARIEAGALRGRRTPSLVPRFTDDGGHLNFEGRLAAASGLVRLLGDLTLRTPEQAYSGLQPSHP